MHIHIPWETVTALFASKKRLKERCKKKKKQIRKFLLHLFDGSCEFVIKKFKEVMDKELYSESTIQYRHRDFTGICMSTHITTHRSNEQVQNDVHYMMG